MKIRYERNPDEDNIFFVKTIQKTRKSLRQKYSTCKCSFARSKYGYSVYGLLVWTNQNEFKDDDLFDPNEKIKIKQASFEAIVKELEIYNLSTTSDDVKGIAFEQFLWRTFRGELGSSLHQEQ